MSERDLTETIIGIIQQDEVFPVIFIYANFPSYPRRIWTGIGDYNDGENIWEGVGGGLLDIQGIGESTDGASKGIAATLNGLDEDLVNALVFDDYQGEVVEIDLGFWNTDTHQLVKLPGHFWKGVLDTDDVTWDQDKVTLTLKAESRYTDILRRREVLYTERDQAYLYPDETDTCLNKLVGIQDKTIPWGRSQR